MNARAVNSVNFARIAAESWYGINAVCNAYKNFPMPCRRLPADNHRTNFELPKVSQIRRSSEMVFLFDGTFLNLQYEPDRIAARHNRNTYTNLLFFDGHATSAPTRSLPGGMGGGQGSAFAEVESLARFPEFLWRLDQQ